MEITTPLKLISYHLSIKINSEKYADTSYYQIELYHIQSNTGTRSYFRSNHQEKKSNLITNSNIPRSTSKQAEHKLFVFDQVFNHHHYHHQHHHQHNDTSETTSSSHLLDPKVTQVCLFESHCCSSTFGLHLVSFF